MRIKPTKGTILLLGVMLAAAVVTFGGAVWFQRQAVDQAVTTLAAREAELADGRQIARQRDSARDAVERDRQELAFLENGVTNSAYVPTLLRQLEDLARGTANKVVGVRPEVVTQAPTRLQQRRDPDAQGSGTAGSEEPEPKPEPYTKLSIDVSFYGTYRSCQAFLARLNRFPKIIAVEEVQFQPHRDERDRFTANQTILDAKAKLTAFVMKENQVPVSPVATASSGATGS